MRITRKLTSIIALSVMVAILLAVVAVTQSGTANAQVAGRTISNLQLSHNDDGHLLISWDAPELAPRDYRVMWAKSSENYKTWTDTTGNAFPTSASHTVSDWTGDTSTRSRSGPGTTTAAVPGAPRSSTRSLNRRQRQRRHRSRPTRPTGCRAPCPITWQCSTGRTSTMRLATTFK